MSRRTYRIKSISLDCLYEAFEFLSCDVQIKATGDQIDVEVTFEEHPAGDGEPFDGIEDSLTMDGIEYSIA